MNTTTIVRIMYPINAEDAKRFSVEYIQDENGKAAYRLNFMSNKTDAIENYKMAREFFKKLFEKPAQMLYHCEDTIEENSTDEKIEKNIRISDKVIDGQALLAYP